MTLYLLTYLPVAVLGASYQCRRFHVPSTCNGPLSRCWTQWRPFVASFDVRQRPQRNDFCRKLSTPNDFVAGWSIKWQRTKLEADRVAYRRACRRANRLINSSWQKYFPTSYVYIVLLSRWYVAKQILHCNCPVKTRTFDHR